MPDLHNTPPPPPPIAGPHVPIQITNPFAAPSTPINVGSVNVSSSMIPSTVKRHVEASQVEKKTDTEKNPIAASLVSSYPSTNQLESESVVPGPKLRFTLVPYGEQDSDDEVPPPPPPVQPSKEDKDLADFMASIAGLYSIY